MGGKVTIDFETRSKVSLNKVGAWNYSRNASTDVLTISWSDGGLETGQWRMGQTPPRELFDLVRQAAVVEAHFSFFETYVWMNVCVARYKWPAIPDHKWRCSAAKAAAMSLPRGLSEAGRALNLETVKDVKEGAWAMKKLSKPRKPTKNDDRVWYDDQADWDKMLAYNVNDVASEEALSAALPDLPKRELDSWLMTERINLRGVPIDVKGCIRAVQMTGEYAKRLTADFTKITGLNTAGQRAAFLVWLSGRGHQLKNTRAKTLDLLVKEPELDADTRYAVEIVRTLGRSSIKKYRSCLDWADPIDARARGCFLWHGAHTGRYAGKGIQPQNFKRECRWNMGKAWDDIHNHDLDTLEMLYGDPLKFFADVTRGAIMAKPGTRFMAGDYAQIEPRKLFWLAGEYAGLETFKRGEDIYLVMASIIYNRLVTKQESEKRFLGKHAILALGYGAGFIKFLMHCRELGAPRFTRKQICDLVPAGWRNATLKWILTDAWHTVKHQIPDADRQTAEELVLTKYVVDRYRTQYKKTVVKLWYDLENAAKNAIKRPGTTYKVANDKIAYTMGKTFLNCRLPSGRIMRYRDARLDNGESISYMTPLGLRTSTWGGKLVENVTQASCGDVMIDAMLKLDQHKDYKDIVMTVHDEVISEVPNGIGKLDEFLNVLATPPAWCHDLPIKVEGWEGSRYRKG